MGLLYLDATGKWSDPASSGRRYLRADGQWAAPDSAHRFLDAKGAYSVPELSLDPWSLGRPPGPGGYQGSLNLGTGMLNLYDGDGLMFSVSLGAFDTVAAYSSTERLRLLLAIDRAAPDAKVDVDRLVVEFPILSNGSGEVTVYPDWARYGDGIYDLFVYQIPPSRGCGYTSHTTSTRAVVDTSRTGGIAYNTNFQMTLYQAYSG